jgi:hypothetical protein
MTAEGVNVMQPTSFRGNLKMADVGFHIAPFGKLGGVIEDHAFRRD